MDKPQTRTPEVGGVRQLPRWLILGALSAVSLPALAILATLRPGDPTLWPPAPSAPTVTVFIISHGYHAGIAMPRAAASEVATQRGLSALVAVAVRFAAYPWLEIG